MSILKNLFETGNTVKLVKRFENGLLKTKYRANKLWKRKTST